MGCEQVRLQGEREKDTEVRAQRWVPDSPTFLHSTWSLVREADQMRLERAEH